MWRMWCEMIQISTELIQLLSFRKIAVRPRTRKKATIACGGFFSNVLSISKYSHSQCSSPQVHLTQALVSAHFAELIESRIFKQMHKKLQFQRGRVLGSRTSLYVSLIALNYSLASRNLTLIQNFLLHYCRALLIFLFY